MGYPVARFEGEVDVEFICSICHDVLKDPLQTPCEHIFCGECIQPWLAADTSCPVDRSKLTADQLKPVHRTLRIFISRLQIRCEFADRGCNEVVELDSLASHVRRCNINPDAQVTCDKGCGLTVMRKHLKDHDCMQKLLAKVSQLEIELLNNIPETGCLFQIKAGLFKREKDTTYSDSEAFELSYVGDSEVQCKNITGSTAVPAGKLHFVADLDHYVQLDRHQQGSVGDIIQSSTSPAIEKAGSQVQTFHVPSRVDLRGQVIPNTCIGRYAGKMQYAYAGFTNPYWQPGHWLIFSQDIMGFLTLKGADVSVRIYHRIKDIQSCKLKISPGLFKRESTRFSEEVKLSYLGDAVQVRKVRTECSKVPHGKLNFVADLSHYVHLNSYQQGSVNDIIKASASPAVEKASSQVQSFHVPDGIDLLGQVVPNTCIGRYAGKVAYASGGFTDPFWKPGHWIIFNHDTMGFLELHETVEFISMYHRVK